MSVLAHSASKKQYSTLALLRATCLAANGEERALPSGMISPADTPCDPPLADEAAVATAAVPALTAAPPRIVYLSVRSGPASGGTAVTILGNYFAKVTEVRFGDAPAASFQLVSGNRLVAVAPPHDAGVVGLRVATPNGTSDAVGYTYQAAPVVTEIKADHGPTRGGTLIVVHGGNFVAGQTKVYFGKRHGKDVKVLSSRLLVVKTPAAEAGPTAIAVTTRDGVSNEVAFVYA